MYTRVRAVLTTPLYNKCGLRRIIQTAVCAGVPRSERDEDHTERRPFRNTTQTAVCAPGHSVVRRRRLVAEEEDAPAPPRRMYSQLLRLGDHHDPPSLILQL